LADLSKDYPDYEVLALDDGSTDGTLQALAAFGRNRACLRVLKGRPLPEGWWEMATTEQLAPDALGLVRVRKDEIARMRDVIPPDTIFGRQALALDRSEGRGLQGTPTSRGVYTGLVRVLQSIQDIGRVQEGDVLVIPCSDVGTTRL
jgi:glycosyltransferase involved in cell wall biosynthesis